MKRKKVFINIKNVRARSAWMTTVKVFDNFIKSGGNIGERDPRVFGFRKGFPMNEVFEAMTNLATIYKSVDVKSRIVGKVEWFRKVMRMKFGMIGIRFEKRNMKYGV
jgi:hypothetical protein